MPSAGILLCSDGSAIRVGTNLRDEQSDVALDYPAIEKFPVEDGITYTQVACCSAFSLNSMVLLRSDGKALSQCVRSPVLGFTANRLERCDIILPADGTVFTQVCLQGPKKIAHDSSRQSPVYLLRSDGRVFYHRSPNRRGRQGELVLNSELVEIQGEEAAMRFSQVAAGGGTLVVLLSVDGRAVAMGSNEHGQCLIPELDAQLAYTQVSAGQVHTALLCSDGQVLTTGSNVCGQRNIPTPVDGIKYTQVSAGGVEDEHHTVLLCSNGEAIAVGSNGHGQCNIPKLKGGLNYIQVCAGGLNTVLLCSNGAIVAVGANADAWMIPKLHGQRSCLQRLQGHTELDEDVKYTSTNAELPVEQQRTSVVQLSICAEVPHECTLICTSIGGNVLKHVRVEMAARVAEVCALLAAALPAGLYAFLLPDGRLLSECCSQTPLLDLVGCAISI